MWRPIEQGLQAAALQLFYGQNICKKQMGKACLSPSLWNLEKTSLKKPFFQILLISILFDEMTLKQQRCWVTAMSHYSPCVSTMTLQSLYLKPLDYFTSHLLLLNSSVTTSSQKTSAQIKFQRFNQWPNSRNFTNSPKLTQLIKNPTKIAMTQSSKFH